MSAQCRLKWVLLQELVFHILIHSDNDASHHSLVKFVEAAYINLNYQLMLYLHYLVSQNCLYDNNWWLFFNISRWSNHSKNNCCAVGHFFNRADTKPTVCAEPKGNSIARSKETPVKDQSTGEERVTVCAEPKGNSKATTEQTPVKATKKDQSAREEKGADSKQCCTLLPLSTLCWMSLI